MMSKNTAIDEYIATKVSLLCLIILLLRGKGAISVKHFLIAFFIQQKNTY